MNKNDQYTEREAAERREAALKRMLATPHRPHAPLGKRPTAKKKSAVGKGRKKQQP